MKMHREMTNQEISKLLKAIAASYQLKDEKKHRFRIIAYERAATAIEHLSSEVKDIWDEDKLTDIAGVGESIASNLDEIFKTGNSKHFQEIIKSFPPVIFELIPLPRIGPKTAFKLATKLKIKSISDLEKRAKRGEIEGIEGFGKESQKEILRAIERFKNRKVRFLLPYAQQIALEVINWMKKIPEVKKIDPLGSLRRHTSTVGDIDISVASNNSRKVLDHFANYPKAKRVIEKGKRTASILLPNEVQVDLMVQSPASYGSLLQHFTGSKHHNIALREHALKKDMSLSEYGIKIKGKLNKFANEEDFYKKLDLDFIPPELREDSGEIEAAKNGKIPKLVQLDDIKGDLHMHTSFDIETSRDLGGSSMSEMVEKANSLNYEYIAFTEHNPSKSRHTEKQVLDILKRKRTKVKKLNESLSGKVKKVFNSLEIDILPDGELAIPEKALDLLDFAVIAIHSSFSLSREKMTKRVLKAFEHPKVIILAHPTTRKLTVREGVELNWSEIFSFSRKHHKWIEISANPARLDLPDILVRDAVKEGVLLTLGSDAHHKDGMNNMIYGLSVARRGWATKKDIVNTRCLNDFEKMIK